MLNIEKKLHELSSAIIMCTLDFFLTNKDASKKVVEGRKVKQTRGLKSPR